MAGISLDDIRKAADDKYGPFVVQGVPGGDVVLLNAIRLPKEKRRQLSQLQKAQAEQDADNAETYLHDMVRLLAEDEDAAGRLLDAIGEDNAALAVLLNEYGEASSLGEASPSAS